MSDIQSEHTQNDAHVGGLRTTDTALSIIDSCTALTEVFNLPKFTLGVNKCLLSRGTPKSIFSNLSQKPVVFRHKSYYNCSEILHRTKIFP